MTAPSWFSHDGLRPDQQHRLERDWAQQSRRCPPTPDDWQERFDRCVQTFRELDEEEARIRREMVADVRTAVALLQDDWNRS